MMIFFTSYLNRKDVFRCGNICRIVYVSDSAFRVKSPVNCLKWQVNHFIFIATKNLSPFKSMIFTEWVIVRILLRRIISSVHCLSCHLGWEERWTDSFRNTWAIFWNLSWQWQFLSILKSSAWNHIYWSCWSCLKYHLAWPPYTSIIFPANIIHDRISNLNFIVTFEDNFV